MTTERPPSVWREPSVVDGASVVLLTFIIPLAETVAAVVEPIDTVPELAASVALVPLYMFILSFLI